MDENGMASDASPNLGLSHTHSVASVDPNMQCPTSLADMQTRVRAAALAEFQALLDATFEVKLLPHVRSQFVGYFEEDIASVLDVATGMDGGHSLGHVRSRFTLGCPQSL